MRRIQACVDNEGRHFILLQTSVFFGHSRHLLLITLGSRVTSTDSLQQVSMLDLIIPSFSDSVSTRHVWSQCVHGNRSSYQIYFEYYLLFKGRRFRKIVIKDSYLDWQVLLSVKIYSHDISLTLHVVVVYFSVINYKLITPTMLQRYWSRPASDKDNSTLHFNFFSFSITSKIW